MDTLKLKTFILRFSTEISLREIPMLRGAIIKATDGENILFHNHDGEKFRYSYPLVQYKRIGGKAAIVFVGEGVDAIADYFKNQVLDVELGNRKTTLELEHADANTTTIGLWNDTFRYTIRKYLPLNNHNYEAYEKAEGVAERCAILERSLTGNILSFAKGIGLHIDGQIDVKITNMSDSTIYIYKGVKMMGFDLEFKSNISLPDYIGLGKGTSLGFGMIKRNIRS